MPQSGQTQARAGFLHIPGHQVSHFNNIQLPKPVYPAAMALSGETWLKCASGTPSLTG
jgi:hypothetical protein